MNDPTAAERARRYRARRAARDVTAQHDAGELVAVLERLVERLDAFLDLVELPNLPVTYPPSAGPVDKRDAGARHAVRRDVTTHHGGEGARPAPARIHAAPSPSGALGAAAIPSRVTDPLVDARARILEVLVGRAPHTVGAIADALGIGTAETVAELVTLAGLGRVRRVAATAPEERDRWELVTESPGETIECSAYREHAVLGHRRDPGTGRFRCYVCDPEYGPDGPGRARFVDPPAAPA